MVCGANPVQIKALTNYAEHLGLAFQIADDILDVTSTSEAVGKPVNADTGKGFPRLIGLEKSRALAETEKKKAIAALKMFGRKSERLKALAEYVLSRKS
jgi:geranylgeranyl diphosphate synthase type II